MCMAPCMCSTHVLFAKLSSGQDVSRWTSRIPRWLAKDGPRWWLVPIHDAELQHWMLCVVDVQDRIVMLLDPLGAQDDCCSHLDIVLKWACAQYHDEESNWHRWSMMRHAIISLAQTTADCHCNRMDRWTAEHGDALLEVHHLQASSWSFSGQRSTC